MANKIKSPLMTTEVHLRRRQRWIAANGSDSNWNWWLPPSPRQNGRRNHSGILIQKQRRQKVIRVKKSAKQSAYEIPSGRRRGGSIRSQRTQSSNKYEDVGEGASSFSLGMPTTSLARALLLALRILGNVFIVSPQLRVFKQGFVGIGTVMKITMSKVDEGD